NNPVRGRTGGPETKSAGIGHDACIKTLCDVHIHFFFFLQSLNEMIYHLRGCRNRNIRIDKVKVIRLLVMVNEYLFCLCLLQPGPYQITAAVRGIEIKAE